MSQVYVFFVAKPEVIYNETTANEALILTISCATSKQRSIYNQIFRDSVEKTISDNDQ